MRLPIFAKKILSALEKEGFEAYCIGGCVRNSLLSLPVSDYDITTNALPEQIKEALREYRLIETGIKHGTVTAIVDDNPVEITTFRNENTYSDHRHPDSVSFSKTLKEDLSRRDFTVNALAFNEKSGIIDLFGGKKDLKKRLIRCVGDPKKRFNEDALRILRALRFASCLGFSIEEKTAAAIKENFSLLSFVSKERIYSELFRLLCGRNASKIIGEFSEVISFCLFAQDKDCSAAIKSAAAALSHLSENIALRLAALFFFTGDTPKKKSESADAALSYLKADKKTKNYVCSLLCSLPIEKAENRPEVKKLLGQHGAQKLSDLLVLECALSPNQNIQTVDFIKEQMEDIIKSGECYALSQLKINGDDLLNLGFEPNRIGDTLNHLLSLVISEKLENESNQLLSAAKKLK